MTLTIKGNPKTSQRELDGLTCELEKRLENGNFLVVVEDEGFHREIPLDNLYDSYIEEIQKEIHDLEQEINPPETDLSPHDMVPVVFVHHGPDDFHSRDTWDLFYNGKREGIKRRELLNLLTLEEEDLAYEEHRRFEVKVKRFFAEGIINRQQDELVQKFPVLCPVKKYSNNLRGRVG